MLDHQNINQERKQIFEERENQRIQNQSVQKEKEDILGYSTLVEKPEDLLTTKKNKKTLGPVAGQSSLVRMKTARERINSKDRDSYELYQEVEQDVMREEMGEEEYAKLQPTQRTFLSEYRQMIRSSHVFDNEVRSTVKEFLQNKPTFIPGKSYEEQTELLSRLLSAFLPEKEFHFYPPSSKQQSKVKDFLKSFKKDPKGQILKMEQSLTGERLSRDFRDADAASSNFRMIYTDMLRREAISAVFPLVFSQNENVEEQREVESIKQTIPAYKEFIKALSALNGIRLTKSFDPTFNKGYVDPATLNSKRQKEMAKRNNHRSGINLKEHIKVIDISGRNQETYGRAYNEYYDAYQHLRWAQQADNNKLKNTLNGMLSVVAPAYSMNKRYREAIALQKRNVARRMENERDFTEEPVEAQNVETHSKNYYTAKFVQSQLGKAINDVNYTRYRRDAIKKLSPGRNMPEGFLKRNKEKEENRLRLLEQRVSDLSELYRLIDDNADFRTFLDQHRNEPKYAKLIMILENEFDPLAKNEQRKEAGLISENIAKRNLQVKEQAFLNLREQDANAPEGADSLTYKLTVSDNLKIEADKLVKDMRHDTIYLEVIGKYKNDIAEAERESLRKKKIKEAKERYYNANNLQMGHVSTFEDSYNKLHSYDERKKKIDAAKRSVAIGESSKRANYIYSRAEQQWNQYMSGFNRQAYYMQLQRLEGNFREYDEKRDIPVLKPEEVDVLLRYYQPDYYKRKLALVDKKPEEIKDEELRRQVESVFRKYKRGLHFNLPEGRDFPPSIKEDLEALHEQHEGTYNLLDRRVSGRLNKILQHYLKAQKEEIETKEEIKTANVKYTDYLRNWCSMYFPEYYELKDKPKDKKKDKDNEPIHLPLPDELQKAFRGFSKLKNYPQGEDITNLSDNEVNSFERLVTPETKKFFDDVKRVFNDKYQPLATQYKKESKDIIKKIRRIVNKEIPRQLKGKELTKDEKDLGVFLRGNSMLASVKMNLLNVDNELKKVLFFGKDGLYRNVADSGFIPSELYTKELGELQEWYEQVAKSQIAEAQKDITKEQTGRLNSLAEIDYLKKKLDAGVFEVPKGYEKIIDSNALKLRTIAGLVIKCKEYLDNYAFDKKKDKDVLGRKEASDEVKKLLTDLSKKYMADLENAFHTKLWNSDAKEINTYQIGKFNDSKFDYTSISTKHRLNFKYLKAWEVLAGYAQVNEKDKKQFDSIKSTYKSRANAYNVLLEGYYVGSESEEKENEYLKNELVYFEIHEKEIEERRKAQEAELKRLLDEAEKQQILENNRKAMDEFEHRVGTEISDISTAYKEYCEMAEKAKNASAVAQARYHAHVIDESAPLNYDNYKKFARTYEHNFVELNMLKYYLDTARENRAFLEGEIKAGNMPDIFNMSTEVDQIRFLKENTIDVLEKAEKDYAQARNLNVNSRVDLAIKFINANAKSDALSKARQFSKSAQSAELIKKLKALSGAFESQLGEVEEIEQLIGMGYDEESEGEEVKTPKHERITINPELMKKFNKTKNALFVTTMSVRGRYIKIIKDSVDSRNNAYLESIKDKEVLTAEDVEAIDKLQKNESSMVRLASKHYLALSNYNPTPEEVEEVEPGAYKEFKEYRDMFEEIGRPLSSRHSANLDQKLQEFYIRTVNYYTDKIDALTKDFDNQSTDRKHEITDELATINAELAKFPEYMRLNPLFDESATFAAQKTATLATERFLYKPVKAEMDELEKEYSELDAKLSYGKDDIKRYEELDKRYSNFLTSDAYKKYVKEGAKDRIEKVNNFRQNITSIKHKIEFDEIAVDTITAEQTLLHEIDPALDRFEQSGTMLTGSEVNALNEYKKKTTKLQSGKKFAKLKEAGNPFVVAMDQRVEERNVKIDNCLAQHKNDVEALNAYGLADTYKSFLKEEKSINAVMAQINKAKMASDKDSDKLMRSMMYLQNLLVDKKIEKMQADGNDKFFKLVLSTRNMINDTMIRYCYDGKVQS